MMHWTQGNCPHALTGPTLGDSMKSPSDDVCRGKVGFYKGCWAVHDFKSTERREGEAVSLVV